MNRKFRVLVLAAAIFSPAVAIAQAPPASKSPVAPQTEVHDPKACAQNQATVGSGGNLDVNKDKQAKSSTLSDKLAKSNGVICPPQNVDKEIKQPTPQGGVMPVIPPPGSPGGDQSVQPK